MSNACLFFYGFIPDELVLKTPDSVLTPGDVILLPGTSRAKHRAGVSAIQLNRMAFLLLDEVEMAASSRQISPTAPWNATCPAR